MESFPDGRGQTMIAGGTGGLGYPPTGGQWAGDPSRRAVPGPGPAVNSAGGRGGTAWSQVGVCFNWNLSAVACIISARTCA